MDPKKKKLYYLIIGACVLVSVGVIIWSRQSSDSQIELTIAPPAQTLNTEKAKTNKVYSVPSVFPNDTKFDLSVLQSSTFKALKPTSGLKLDDQELGRENPFSHY